MPKNYIIDTNVMLHNPGAVFQFGEHCVIIPIEVIEDVDTFKHDATEQGRNSRSVAQILDALRAKGRLGKGVELDSGGTLRVVCGGGETGPGPGRHSGSDRVANSILRAALQLQADSPNDDTIIVTKNVNLRLKADALDLTAEDYIVDRFPDADLYPGWLTLTVSAESFAGLAEGRKCAIAELNGVPNEYVLARSEDDAKSVVLGRVDRDGRRVVPLTGLDRATAGITPLNLEQTFARDALLNDDIKLVTLTGKAGTGKTLLAVAAGLYKVFGEDRYHRVLVFRPTMPVSRDIGYLPGGIEEKMRPWMQPIYDALELIRECDKRSSPRILPPDVIECEELCIEPLTYIRGRSIPRQYIIIDEAQNLTPLEIKTVITRVGSGTKIVLTGDPHQIDNPYVDALSNGLAFLVDRFRSSGLSAHLCLAKGERSDLAETAANLL